MFHTLDKERVKKKTKMSIKFVFLNTRHFQWSLNKFSWHHFGVGFIWMPEAQMKKLKFREVKLVLTRVAGKWQRIQMPPFFVFQCSTELWVSDKMVKRAYVHLLPQGWFVLGGGWKVTIDSDTKSGRYWKWKQWDYIVGSPANKLGVSHWMRKKNMLICCWYYFSYCCWVRIGQYNCIYMTINFISFISFNRLNHLHIPSDF